MASSSNPDLPFSNDADTPREKQTRVLAASYSDDEETQRHLDLRSEIVAPNIHASTMLHNAASIEEVRLLIDAGANISAVDVRNETRLHIAALDGETEVVRLLLNAGASVLARNFNGATPLHMAARNDHEDAVQLLINAGSDLSSVSDRGATPLHWAVYDGAKVSTTKMLLDAGADVIARAHDGETPLHKAAGYYKLMELLVNSGADVLAASNSGWTPLHSGVVLGCPEQVQLLLDAGADVKAKTRKGETALHFAAENMVFQEMVQLLLDGGADINATTGSGETALHRAAGRWLKDATQLLIDRGVDVNAATDEGETAFHRAAHAESGDIRLVLSDAGLNVMTGGSSGKKALFRGARRWGKVTMQMLIDGGADINAATDKGETALHLAALAGLGDILQVLLEARADITAKTKNGDTPLCRAESGRSETLAELRRRMDCAGLSIGDQQHILEPIDVSRGEASRLLQEAMAGASRARAVGVGLGALAGDALAPADQQCAARRHARADDADVDLDGGPQPGHVAEPGDVPGVDKDDGDVVQADRGGDDDQQTGREEGEDVHPLREADLQQDQAAQGDDEDDDVEDEEDDEDDGDEVAYDAREREFSDDFVDSCDEDPQVEDQNGRFCEIAGDGIEDLAAPTEFSAGDLGREWDIPDVSVLSGIKKSWVGYIIPKVPARVASCFLMAWLIRGHQWTIGKICGWGRKCSAGPGRNRSGGRDDGADGVLQDLAGTDPVVDTTAPVPVKPRQDDTRSTDIRVETIYFAGIKTPVYGNNMFDITVFSLATAHATLLKPSFVSESVEAEAGATVPLWMFCTQLAPSSEFNQSGPYPVLRNPSPPSTARPANNPRTGDVSDALQNMMLQHGDMRTFIKHNLPRRVTADTRAIVSGYGPKTTLDLAYDMPQPQRRLVETIITLPGTTLEEEIR
ncbi:hypothetical protein V502_00309 [Pseudogymnoascus sp. VKM F-4520 (FW-2644)]|nr:hypothetical protein V502_00309 [Pseudogymnoascus sp. VKM F-4520 (FW-2644)]